MTARALVKRLSVSEIVITMYDITIVVHEKNSTPCRMQFRVLPCVHACDGVHVPCTNAYIYSAVTCLETHNILEHRT